MKSWFCCIFPRELTLIEKKFIVIEYLNDLSPFVNLSPGEIDVIQKKIMERKCARKDLYQNI